jgi:hypothetical protein
VLNWLARYAPVRALLVEDGRLGGSLLDVGCGSHGFACVAPELPFVGMDMAFPHAVAPSMTALRSDGARFPFKDAAFSTVLCLDVLEHVPPSHRADFLQELARVAAKRVVVACPASGAASIDDFIRWMYEAQGSDVPEWLEEHERYGLPHPTEVKAMARACHGFDLRPLPMPNGLLAALSVLGDLLPVLSRQAATEAGQRREEWVELFNRACFGPSLRVAWVLERRPHQEPADRGDHRNSRSRVAFARVPALRLASQEGGGGTARLRP